MIADALRFEIEAYAERMRLENPLVVRSAEGTVNAATVGRYLASLRYLVAQTPALLVRAREHSLARGRYDLATHFATKLGEEQGHDRWAESDIEALASARDARWRGAPEPAIVELCAYLEREIERDPQSYLAYMLLAEYVTVLVGPELIGALVTRCGIPLEALSCVAKHAELDREHTADGLDAIDALVGDPRELASMRDMLHASMAFFDRFCAELMHARHDQPELRVAV